MYQFYNYFIPFYLSTTVWQGTNMSSDDFDDLIQLYFFLCLLKFRKSKSIFYKTPVLEASFTVFIRNFNTFGKNG